MRGEGWRDLCALAKGGEDELFEHLPATARAHHNVVVDTANVNPLVAHVVHALSQPVVFQGFHHRLYGDLLGHRLL